MYLFITYVRRDDLYIKFVNVMLLHFFFRDFFQLFKQCLKTSLINKIYVVCNITTNQLKI